MTFFYICHAWLLFLCLDCRTPISCISIGAPLTYGQFIVFYIVKSWYLIQDPGSPLNILLTGGGGGERGIYFVPDILTKRDLIGSMNDAVMFLGREKNTGRRVATCKPGKPGLTNFSKTLALFFIQFLSFWKMRIQDRQNSPSGLPGKTGWPATLSTGIFWGIVIFISSNQQ